MEVNLSVSAPLCSIELFGDVKEMEKLENALKKLEGVEVNKMVFVQ